mmetsp:Transcript_139387/g.347533  ORF Transcript_139387/g.347533 Transcript_139387/m.347533 type:complete len:237 (-) Transcript_139387:83-793(-)
MASSTFHAHLRWEFSSCQGKSMRQQTKCLQGPQADHSKAGLPYAKDWDVQSSEHHWWRGAALSSHPCRAPCAGTTQPYRRFRPIIVLPKLACQCQLLWRSIFMSTSEMDKFYTCEGRAFFLLTPGTRSIQLRGQSPEFKVCFPVIQFQASTDCLLALRTSGRPNLLDSLRSVWLGFGAAASLALYSLVYGGLHRVLPRWLVPTPMLLRRSRGKRSAFTGLRARVSILVGLLFSERR